MGHGKNRVTRQGLAVLGPEELRFHTGRTGRSGKDFFLHIRYDAITSLAVNASLGLLVVATPEHDDATFHLGRLAAAWKKIIEERPRRLDELGVKPKSKIAVIAVDDDELYAELAARVSGFDPAAADAAITSGKHDLDVLIVGAEHKADLPRVVGLASHVKKPGGVIWVVHPTESRALPTHEIAAAARAVRLVDAGTITFSATHTAIKLSRV